MIFFTILVSVLLCFGSQSEYSHFKIRSAKAVAASFTGSQQNHTARADFIVMKQIIIQSPKYGKFIVKVDDDDFVRVAKFNWFISFSKKIAYVKRRINGKNAYLHRFIMKAKNSFDVDHIDGDTLNNCKNNLRICSHMENCRNGRVHYDNKTGYRGVHFYKSRNNYQVSIMTNGKRKSGGYFKKAKDAAKRYNELALKYHGKFANINII